MKKRSKITLCHGLSVLCSCRVVFYWGESKLCPRGPVFWRLYSDLPQHTCLEFLACLPWLHGSGVFNDITVGGVTAVTPTVWQKAIVAELVYRLSAVKTHKTHLNGKDLCKINSNLSYRLTKALEKANSICRNNESGVSILCQMLTFGVKSYLRLYIVLTTSIKYLDTPDLRQDYFSNMCTCDFDRWMISKYPQFSRLSATRKSVYICLIWH